MTDVLDLGQRVVALLFEHSDCTTLGCLVARIAPVANLIFLVVLVWKIRR